MAKMYGRITDMANNPYATCSSCKYFYNCLDEGDFFTYAISCINFELNVVEKKEDQNTKHDNVNHPSHYETGAGFECKDVMLEVFGKDALQHFYIVNVFKYLYRHKRKNGLEDIKKAKWYLDAYLELEDKDD